MRIWNVIMVNKCALCSSGHAGSVYNGPYFSFPPEKQAELRQKWLDSVPKKNYTPSASARLCALHFDPVDIETERKDKRGKRAALGELDVKHLRSGAVPQIWPGYPEYVSKTISKRRSLTSGSDARAEREKLAQLQRDSVSSIEELREKLKKTAIPPDVNELIDAEGNLVYFSMITLPTPVIKFSIIISPDMSYIITVDNIVIQTKQRKELISSPKINLLTDVLSLIDYARNFSGDIPVNCTLKTARSLLETCANADDDKAPKIGFVIVQLDLLGKPPKARRYSPYTLAMCLTWYKSSPTLYRQIQSENLLTLPSVSYLRRLASAVTVDYEFTDSTIAYLKARIAKLSDREKNTALVLDEVHTDQKVNFIGGSFDGLNEDGFTKTLLSVMVKSLCGKYRDMIAMIPTVSLKSEKMLEVFNNTLKGVTEIGFTVCATVVDGNRVNKKFYSLMCGSKVLPTSIENPFKSGLKIFPLYDAPHIFKCFYNLFMTRSTFMIPSFGDFDEMKADFSHIRKLYEIELGKSPKLAHKSNNTNLSSKPVERVNVLLADAIFHESTIDGLEVYSEQYPEFKQIAVFLRHIRKWWNIVNVAAKNTGIMKRDDTKKPVTLADLENNKYLRNFADWLTNWKEKGEKTSSLSADTFATAIHTSKTLPDLSEYLIRERGFEYVLYRHINQDCLEGGFGERRQMHGGNYYAASRQFLEAEKTIRIKCLIKYNGMNMKDIKKIFLESKTMLESKVKAHATEFLDMIEFSLNFQHITMEDNSILFYTSGYIARMLKTREKCKECAQILVKDEGSPTIDVEAIGVGDIDPVIWQSKENFLTEINRGGLCKPSDAVHTATLHV